MSGFDRMSGGSMGPPPQPVRGVRWAEPTEDVGDRGARALLPAANRGPAATSSFDDRADPARWMPAGPGPSPAAEEHGPPAGKRAYGRPAWFAVLVMLAVTAIGVFIDVARDATGGVDIAIIVGALVAIVIVRRLAMFPVVIAPPLVYMLGSAAVLYLRSGGPHSRTVLIAIATNWLVYGFPAMAAATAIVLAIAAVRMLARR